MKYYFIDLFCGFGGTSYGIHGVGKDAAEVVWAVNHDCNAIASHQLNNPDVYHSIEDIRTLDLTEMIKVISGIRARDRNAVICLWASLECTNHSNAKGGMSRDADSRTLGEHLFRYVEAINPEMIWIENVREFKDWGPLYHKYSEVATRNPVMVPVKERKGEDYKKWVDNMCSYGYQYDHKLLNSADFGARTSRNRLFIQFVKNPLKIYWPEASHDKLGRNGLEKWLPVAPVLDLHETGKSIFRDKPLSDKTYERILRGVKKHHSQFFIKYYGNGDNTCSLDAPGPTLTTKDRMSLITTHFIAHEYGDKGNGNSLEEPLRTITTTPKAKLVTTHFLIDTQYGNNGIDIDKQCPTLIAKMDKKPRYLVSSEMNNIHVPICKHDSKSVVEIKEFMQEKGIGDIKMRGLSVPEMLQIMGFPADYKIKGTVTDAKKFIGNAVETTVAKKLILNSYNKNVLR